MAISEKTKQVVARQKANLRQRYEANLVDIEAHQKAIAEIKARNVTFKAEYDALHKDIPEPTPVESPV